MRKFWLLCVMKPELADLLSSCEYKTSRSGGKGGQNVNKVSSKVELVFDILSTTLFTEEEKQKLQIRLEGKLDSEGKLHVISQVSRSQLENKKIAGEKLFIMLEKALQDPKARKATKPSKASKEKRLTEKKKSGIIKKLRSQRPE